MNSLIIALIYTAFLYSSAQAAVCDSTNPCHLGGFYSLQNGYQCIQKDPNTALCTCPGGVEENFPCRPCGRINPAQNACRNTTGRLVKCLENTDFGTSYVCLCLNGIATTNADCDTTVTLTPRPMTSTVSSGAGSVCSNGGVLVGDICNCPSGYSGALCSEKNEPNLCERIKCKNNGTCAIRNTNGPYESVCLCRYGTGGDYCELIGTLGFCSASSCMNGGACVENVIGATRFAYCRCPAGYNGAKCENRYFICPGVGKYADPTMFDQGKYFECTNVGGALRIEQKSCPKGLRYNQNLKLCTY